MSSIGTCAEKSGNLDSETVVIFKRQELTSPRLLSTISRGTGELGLFCISHMNGPRVLETQVRVLTIQNEDKCCLDISTDLL
jgi:hypothetical protein